MTQQELEKELKDVKESLTSEIGKLSGSCHDLAEQIAALRKRLLQIEVDVYKDISTGEESMS